METITDDSGEQVQEQVSVQLRLRASPPMLQSAVVRRLRLEERLDRSIQLPVTLVSAAPGSGKTMAIASWLAGREASAPAAWLALDRSDNDLRTFWSDLLAALIASGALADTELREVLPAAGFGPVEALKVRTGLAALPAPVVLVLDDVHLLTDPAVLQSLDRLLDDQSSLLRLVLITRVDPPLKLRRLRLNSQLTEIRAADLAFTDGETAELFGRSGFELSTRQLGMLHARTQGWPAGVRLAALSLDSGDVEASIERFSGNERSVAEYLVGEILDGLTPSDRDFLLKTGLTERISAGLATALTGQPDSQAVLERLAGANALVVALAGGTDWFGYHPLLRDLLEHRLELEQPGGSAELHLRASRWFVAHDEPIPGIRHASLAQDWDEVGRILLFTGAPLLVTPDAAALAAALRPAAARSAMHPSWSTLMAAAACHFQDGDLDSMRQDVVEASQYVPGLGEEISSAAEIFLAMLMIPYNRGRSTAGALVGACTNALQLLDQAPRRLAPAGRPFRVVAENNMAVGLLWSGEFDEAARRFSTAEVQAREFRLGLTELNVQAHLAVLAVIHGQLRSAHQQVEALQLVLDRRGWGSEGQALGVYLTYAMTNLAWNHQEKAAGQIERGLAVSANGSDLASRLALGIASVAVGLAGGDESAAAAAAGRLAVTAEPILGTRGFLSRWCSVAQAQAELAAGTPQSALDCVEHSGQDAGYADALERIVLARAHLQLDQPERALGLLRPLLGRPARYLVQSVEARVLAGLAAQLLRRGSSALTSFGQAIELAEPENIVSPFLNLGPGVGELLAVHRQVVARQLPFTTTLLAALSAYDVPVGPTPPAFDHLTERELVVLRYLPTMLKAAEIASDLFVSVNTVKQHNKSIYRKLGAVTRRDAVDRARALNLL